MSADGAPSRAVADGLLAGVALAGVLLAGRRHGAGIRPREAALGAVGAVGAEAVLARRRDAVRRWWERPGVGVGSLLAFGIAARVGLRIEPDRTTSTLAGGLVGYLVVLALVNGGVVPPPRRWPGGSPPG
jgi:hypothetical protein